MIHLKLYAACNSCNFGKNYSQRRLSDHVLLKEEDKIVFFFFDQLHLNILTGREIKNALFVSQVHVCGLENKSK